VVFAALLLTLWPEATAQTRGDAASSPFNPAPYRVGERLSYNVSFSNFPAAGHVRLEVAGRGQFYGREGVELRAHVETLGVVNAALYAINNDYVTYVEPSNGLPYRAQQSIREGARTENLAADFNVPEGVSALPPRREGGGLFGSFDLLSALYRARALPLAQGAVYTISVRQGGSVYNAELKVVGRETVKTGVGTAGAVVAQVRVSGNDVVDGYRLRVYFSEDERRVPLLFTARLKAGELRAELASAEIVTPGQPGAPKPDGTLPPAATLPPAGLAPAAPGARPPAATQTPTPATPPAAAAEDLPFKPGDQLNFTFFLGPSPQPVGTASFQVRERARYFGREGLLFSSSFQTAGAGQTLFPVSDQINSYVDAQTLLPFRTELNLREGDRRESFTVSLDQNGGTALFADGTRVEIPVGTHDLVSVFFALRSFDLTPPKRNAVSLLVNKRPRLLSVTALRGGVVVLGGERIEAVELALATNDPDGDRFQLRLWVSTDKRKLPLRLTAQTPLGPLRADLSIITTRLQ
jgi:hypothetical protein